MLYLEEEGQKHDRTIYQMTIKQSVKRQPVVKEKAPRAIGQ